MTSLTISKICSVKTKNLTSLGFLLIKFILTCYNRVKLSQEYHKLGGNQ